MPPSPLESTCTWLALCCLQFYSVHISQSVHSTLTYPQGKKLNITLEENDEDEGEVTDEDEAEEIDQTHKVKPEEVISFLKLIFNYF